MLHAVFMTGNTKSFPIEDAAKIALEFAIK